jgi:hypothetical protein
MLLLPWSVAFGCGYEFELAEEERRGTTPTDTTDDDSEIDTSGESSHDTSTDMIQDDSSESESQVTSTSSISTENESDDDPSTEQELPVCPEKIEFPPQDATLTDLASGKKTGTQFLDTCPKGQVVIGFHGLLRDFTTALVHGQMQAICGSLSLKSVKNQCVLEIKPADTLPLRGLNGDIEWTRTCPDHEIVVGFGAKTGMDIDQLTFYCAPLFIHREGESYLFDKGSINALPLVGGPGGGTVVGLISCPDDTVARGTNIHSDILVTGFGLACHRLTLY